MTFDEIEDHLGELEPLDTLVKDRDLEGRVLNIERQLDRVVELALELVAAVKRRRGAES